MYIEIWYDLVCLLDDIKPLCKPVHKVGCEVIRAWAVLNKARHHGLLQINIDAAVKALTTVQEYLPDEWNNKIDHAIYFLDHLNDSPDPRYFERKTGCLFWGYNWWDGGCHVEACPPPPPPPPPPPEKLCSDHLSERECLTDGCYWYDNACHDQAKPPEPPLPPDPPPDPPLPPTPPKPPPGECETEEECTKSGYFWQDDKCYLNTGDFLHDVNNLILITIWDVRKGTIKPMMETARDLVDKWYDLLFPEVVEWADQAALVEALLATLKEWYIDPVNEWAQDVAAVIGDVTKLNGKTIIDLLEEKVAGEESENSRLARMFLGVFIEYNEKGEKEAYATANGIIGKVERLLADVYDEQNNLILFTMKDMDDRLKDVYGITKEIFAKVKSESEYAYDEIKKVEKLTGMTLSQVIEKILVDQVVITDTVSGEIGDLILDESKPLEYWIPATRGWVNDQLMKVGEIVIELVEGVTEELAKSINWLLELVTTLPQWWIDELKKKLAI